jgi:hypothetical protein
MKMTDAGSQLSVVELEELAAGETPLAAAAADVLRDGEEPVILGSFQA